jgi:hypothetical protein
MNPEDGIHERCSQLLPIWGTGSSADDGDEAHPDYTVVGVDGFYGLVSLTGATDSGKRAVEAFLFVVLESVYGL